MLYACHAICTPHLEPVQLLRCGQLAAGAGGRGALRLVLRLLRQKRRTHNPVALVVETVGHVYWQTLLLEGAMHCTVQRAFKAASPFPGPKQATGCGPSRWEGWKRARDRFPGVAAHTFCLPNYVTMLHPWAYQYCAATVLVPLRSVTNARTRAETNSGPHRVPCSTVRKHSLNRIYCFSSTKSASCMATSRLSPRSCPYSLMCTVLQG